jgi:DNA-binding MarR family transcriptional regulator
MHRGPALDEIHGAIGCLQRLTDMFEERRAQLAQGVGLTAQQWHVLEEISTEHFMPSMFARRRESSAAAVSKILRQLSDKRLISASVSKEDARQRKYGLTARGEDVMRRIRKSRMDAIQKVWQPLARADVQEFTQISARLLERLETYARASDEKTLKRAHDEKAPKRTNHAQNAV